MFSNKLQFSKNPIHYFIFWCFLEILLLIIITGISEKCMPTPIFFYFIIIIFFLFFIFFFLHFNRPC